MSEEQDNDNGIIVNLNGLNRPQFRALSRQISEARDKGDWAAVDEGSGKLAAAVIESWPYEAEISVKGYLSLGLLDVQAVDRVVAAALDGLSKKN